MRDAYRRRTLLLACLGTVAGLFSGQVRQARADFVFGPPAPLDPPINLGPVFSSFEGEWYPCISTDALELYLTSDQPGGSGGADLWVATRPSQNDPWGMPVNLGAQVNTSAWDGGPSLSADGLALYFYSWRSGSSGDANLWMTTRDSKNALWGSPVPLASTINTSSSERDPSISSDGLTLYYSTDRGGSFDIWQVTRNSVDDPWRGPGEPISIVNSSVTDRYPGISADGLSLFVCSDREGGYDSLDIYVATRASLNSPWGEPMNMGDTINTRLDETSPCMSSDGLSLYLSDYSDVYVAQRTDLSAAFGTPVSISSNEGCAQLSPDGLTLYFASGRAGTFGRNDIWVAYRDSFDAAWNDPVNLGPAVNSSDLDWAPSVSLDGLELYFSSYNEGRLTDSNIWVCTRATPDEPWGRATLLGSPINTDAREYHPTISPDKLMLIFSSTRAGGSGQADLYAARRASVSEPWVAVENLGPNINSEYYDYWPSLSPNGRFLFYGSNRPETPTYKDIMVSRLQANGSWGPARNLALEIELPETAGGPTVAGDGSALFFWSFSQGGPGGGDIWKVDLLPLADLNGDGSIDGQDLCAVVNHWGQNEAACDIGPSPMGDGIVDVEDLLVVTEHLGDDVVDPTLVAHWTCDEAEGLTAHDSTGQNDGTVMGGGVWQPDGGALGGALELDGVTAFVVTEFTVDSSEGPFSIFAWVKGGTPGQAVISQQAGGDWLFANPVDGTLATECVGRLKKLLCSDAVITDGQWHRVGFTWDGFGRTLYVDGEEVAGDAEEVLGASDQGLTLGAGKYLSPGTFFTGLIDDVRIYNRAVKP